MPTPTREATMFSANAYAIRRAGEADAPVLRHLAALDSQSSFGGAALIGEIANEPAAAISLETGRVVADPFRPTAALVTHLRMRAGGIEAAARTPRLRDRIRAGIRLAPRSPITQHSGGG